MDTNNTSALRRELAISAFYDRQIPTAVITILFAAISLPGNVIVLLVYWKQKKMTATQFLLCIMAVCDVIVASVLSPIAVVMDLSWLSILDLTLCKLYHILRLLFINPGLLLMLAVTVVRYYHLCRPHHLSWFEAKLKHFCIFTLAHTICISTTVGIINGESKWREDERDLPGFYCYIDDDYRNSILQNINAFLALFVYMSCIICNCVLNTIIMKTMIKQRSQLSGHKKKYVQKSTNQAVSKPGVTDEKVSFNVRKSGVKTPDDTEATEKCRDNNTVGGVGSSRVSCKSPVLSRKTTTENLIISRTNSATATVVKTDIFSNIYTDHMDVQASRKNTLGEWGVSDSKIIIDHNKSKRMDDKMNEVRLKTMRMTSHADEIIREVIQVDGHADRKQVGRCNCCKCCKSMRGLNEIGLKVFVVNFFYFLAYVAFFSAYFWINMGVYKSRSSNHQLFKYFLLPSLRVLILNGSFNPIVYWCLDSNFRRQCRKLFKKN